jgi:hypothetical protein
MLTASILYKLIRRVDTCNGKVLDANATHATGGAGAAVRENRTPHNHQAIFCLYRCGFTHDAGRGGADARVAETLEKKNRSGMVYK